MVCEDVAAAQRASQTIVWVFTARAKMKFDSDPNWA